LGGLILIGRAGTVGRAGLAGIGLRGVLLGAMGATGSSAGCCGGCAVRGGCVVRRVGRSITRACGRVITESIDPVGQLGGGTFLRGVAGTRGGGFIGGRVGFGGVGFGGIGHICAAETLEKVQEFVSY